MASAYIYGELNIPLLKDKPFFYRLELAASGRYTHYRSYGAETTYRFNANWAPIEEIRFRGSYGTSFRAPNLYEQFVADQTGFYGSNVDPCSGFGDLEASSTVYKNCLATLTPILGTGAVDFIATSGPTVTTTGGAGRLKAERSRSWGGGVVLTAPRTVADLQLAIDYFDVLVKDEVTVLGNLILNRCYEADDFGPNNTYCALISDRLPASDPQRGNLDSFSNPYLNVAQQRVRGIDFDLRYATDAFGGKFVAHAQATRMINQIFQLFSTDDPEEYNGTLGVQGAGAGPKWVASLDLRYTLPSEKVVLRYGVDYVGPQDSSDDELAVAPFLGQVATDLRAEAYWEHSLSVQFRWQDIGQVTFGVTNLFNTKPPRISSYPTSAGQFTRIGNYFNSSNYDILGRQLYLNVTRTF